MKIKPYFTALLLLLTLTGCGDTKHEYIARPPGGDGILIQLRQESGSKIPVVVTFETQADDETWQQVFKMDLKDDFIIINSWFSGVCSRVDKGEKFKVVVSERQKTVQTNLYSCG